jgi:hypothetical protein
VSLPGGPGEVREEVEHQRATGFAAALFDLAFLITIGMKRKRELRTSKKRSFSDFQTVLI